MCTVEVIQNKLKGILNIEYYKTQYSEVNYGRIRLIRVDIEFLFN